MEIRDQIAELEARETVLMMSHPQDENELNIVRNRLSELRDTLGEQEVREQKHAEVINGLMESVIELALFEAIEPKPEDGERIHEYDERRKDFNIIFHDFVKEQLDAQKERHNAEIEAKNGEILKVREEIRAGAERELQLQRQNDELQKELTNTIANYERDRDLFVTKEAELAEERIEAISERNEWVNKYNFETEQLAIKNTYLEIKVTEFEAKLAEANKPKEYTAPSESLSDRVNSLKNKSIKELSADEMIRRFNERQADENKIDLPTLNIGEVAQPGNTFPEVESISDQLPATEEGENVATFPEAADRRNEADGLQLDGDSNQTEVHGETLEARVAKLESRVDQLYRVANISEVA